MPPTVNLLHVLGKQLSNTSDCSVWKIAFNSEKSLVCAKICFPTLRLLMLACFKKIYTKKSGLSVAVKNPSPLLLYPFYSASPPPSRRGSNHICS